LPHRFRIVSGIPVPLRSDPRPGRGPGKQLERDDIRHAGRESNDFNLKATRAVRVQTVNGAAAAMTARPDS